MSQYDAIVIGAGSVGTPTAYFLAKEGMRVLCIDPNASAGQGANKAAIGGVRATHSDPAKIKLCQESLRIFSGWEEETGQGIGWKMGGYCFPVYRDVEEKVLKSILPIQKRFELNIDWRDADFIREKVPGINPDGLVGGTFSPEDGQVSPLMAAYGFCKEARQLGAEFRFRENATGLIVSGGRVTGVRTDRGEYLADIVVNSAGGRASEVCKMAGLDIPILPDSHEGGISAPVKQFLDPLVVDLRPGDEGRTSNFYFGQNHENRIIFCYTPKPIFPGEDVRCTSEFMPIIARRLVALIPRLKNLMVRRLWRGVYPMTPDGVPIVGRAPGVEGLYLAIGLCGQGFMLGPGVGRNLAALIAHGKPLVDAEVFDMLSPGREFHKKVEALK